MNLQLFESAIHALHNCIMNFAIIAATSNANQYLALPPFLFIVGVRGEPGNKAMRGFNL